MFDLQKTRTSGEFDQAILRSKEILLKHLKFFLVALIALSSLGCGSSRNDYVYTGNANPGLNGDVTFQFTKTAAQALVPTNTTRLHFDFYSELDLDGDPVRQADEAYASSVTIEDVPTSATYVVITAYGEHNIPLASISTPIAIYGGQNTQADLVGVPVTPITTTAVSASAVTVGVGLNATPTVSATFSNNETVTPLHSSLFTIADFNESNASYLATTGFSGKAAGNTTYTATFGGKTSAAATLAVTLTQLVVTPKGMVVNPYVNSFNATVSDFIDNFDITVKVVNGQTTLVNATPDFTYDTTLGGDNPSSFNVSNTEVFTVTTPATAGHWATFPLHYTFNGIPLSTTFEVVVGPTAYPQQNHLTATAGLSFTRNDYFTFNTNGTPINNTAYTWAQLKAATGFTDVTLVSADPTLLTTNSTTGEITVAADAQVGDSGVVWLMKGDLILYYTTVTVES